MSLRHYGASHACCMLTLAHRWSGCTANVSGCSSPVLPSPSAPLVHHVARSLVALQQRRDVARAVGLGACDTAQRIGNSGKRGHTGRRNLRQRRCAERLGVAGQRRIVLLFGKVAVAIGLELGQRLGRLRSQRGWGAPTRVWVRGPGICRWGSRIGVARADGAFSRRKLAHKRAAQADSQFACGLAVRPGQCTAATHLGRQHWRVAGGLGLLSHLSQRHLPQSLPGVCYRVQQRNARGKGVIAAKEDDEAVRAQTGLSRQVSLQVTPHACREKGSQMRIASLSACSKDARQAYCKPSCA